MLSADDLALLRREGCVVDGEAAARAYAVAIYNNADVVPLDHQRVGTAAVLRAVGLPPGQPAEHLIGAALERRGWYADPEWSHRGGRSRPDGRTVVWTNAWRNGVRVRGESDHPDRATRLALAFVAAVRAAEETTDDER